MSIQPPTSISLRRKGKGELPRFHCRALGGHCLCGLRRALLRAGLEPERVGVHIGPTVTMITLWPAKFLDWLLVKKRSAHRLAFGVYDTARKPGA